MVNNTSSTYWYRYIDTMTTRHIIVPFSHRRNILCIISHGTWYWYLLPGPGTPGSGVWHLSTVVLYPASCGKYTDGQLRMKYLATAIVDSFSINMLACSKLNYRYGRTGRLVNDLIFYDWVYQAPICSVQSKYI